MFKRAVSIFSSLSEFCPKTVHANKRAATIMKLSSLDLRLKGDYIMKSKLHFSHFACFQRPAINNP